MLNIHLTDEAWVQASLPVRYGGIGIRGVSELTLQAFLSSAHGCKKLFDSIVSPALGLSAEVSQLPEAMSAWSFLRPKTRPKSLRCQHQWDAIACKAVQQGLLSSCSSAVDRARLLAVFERESGLWLSALPSPNLGTLFDDCSLSMCVGLRLGLRTNHPHSCRCGGIVDDRGHHALSCRMSAGRIPRHASLNDLVRRALVSANVPAVLEPIGIVRSDGKRPDGLTLVPWGHGKSLVWDATCVDTLAPSHLQATSSCAGAAAATAERNKIIKYNDLTGCYSFTPLGFETMGSWGPDTKTFIRDLSARLNEATGDKRSGSFLRQRLSQAIQRGNAASLLGSMPRGDGLGDVLFINK